MSENHIIRVNYSAGGYTKARAAYQYDYGQVLELEGFPELPSSFEMHFSIGGGQAITRIGTDGTVAIPNVCLERYGTATAWLFLHDAVTDGETKYTIEIPVRGRAKTTDQEPTPAERSVITETIAALNAGVNAAEAAQGAAETAQGKAEEAQGAAETAQGKAEEAQGAAEAAANSVRNATATAETLEPGSDATVTVRDVSGVKTFEFGIPAGVQGETGNGIQGAVLNNDYTLTITYTDGTSYTTPSIRGATGNGIQGAVLNNDYTLTITYTDGTSYTTPSIRGAKGDTGATPAMSIGTVTTGAAGSSAAATMTGTPEAPVLNLTIPRGDPGNATIDDTAGVGDRTKVWSADKSASEQQSVLSAIDEISEVKAVTVSRFSSVNKYNIDSSGNIIAVTSGDYEVYYAEVKRGIKYNITAHDTSGSLVCAFYYTVPSTSTSAYQSQRIVQTSMEITAPIDGYIGFRSSFTQTNEGISFRTGIDSYARGEYSTLTASTAKLGKELHDLIVNPEGRNGSAGNEGNTKCITYPSIPLIVNASKIAVRNTKPVGTSGNYYTYDVSAWDGTTLKATRLSGVSANEYEELIVEKNVVIGGSGSVNAFGITIHEYESGGTEATIRITDFANYPLVVRYLYDDTVETLRDIDNEETLHKNRNARKASNPLTLLHFSDLHADTGALSRIVRDGEQYGNTINGMICTGDMVSNTGESISSWWDKNVMVCIGNHDTATYSGGVYDWTAVSIADRIAYYISPFENNWGITRPSGKSYYYKDYATQNVRLIVMDVMIYNDGGQDATDQTTWLSELLASAITSNLHVLIAIHCPHGGAEPVECSFSKYDETTMQTLTNCNTPQSVIDAVETAKTSGLKFIGYIVGHMHQDDIWDAENNGRQLMYCVTCATTASGQNATGDQYRDKDNDAYNLVTIDTAKTLVKIVRGGGANIDNHMRTRRAICFDYSTGEKVGEVL